MFVRQIVKAQSPWFQQCICRLLHKLHRDYKLLASPAQSWLTEQRGRLNLPGLRASAAPRQARQQYAIFSPKKRCEGNLPN